ncbi:hypothetical protein BC826DRAFT_1177339 [Russula brevipes]|nr:hypothetical protein BC826DRAFT_1177339 [Russula brevipes]
MMLSESNVRSDTTYEAMSGLMIPGGKSSGLRPPCNPQGPVSGTLRPPVYPEATTTHYPAAYPFARTPTGHTTQAGSETVDIHDASLSIATYARTKKRVQSPNCIPLLLNTVLPF